MPTDAAPEGRISLDEHGKVVGFDDVAAEHLALSANRVLRLPYAEALVPGLAAAIQQASGTGEGSGAWARGHVQYEPHAAGATVLLRPLPRPDPAPLVLALTGACDLADLAAVLGAYGHLIAPSGSVSVQVGQSGTWVPAAAWGEAQLRPFPGNRCPAVRTGLAHVAREGEPMGCPVLGATPCSCVPIHRPTGTMLLAVLADDPAPATQVALAIQARASHPDWRD